jgi:ABC-type multidrug transport system fused ATPase/permease subunit
MVTSAASTILAVAILNMHGMTGKREMPVWMRRIVFNWLGNLACMGDSASIFAVRKVGELAKKSASLSSDIVPVVSNGSTRLNTFSSLGEMAIRAANKAKEERSQKTGSQMKPEDVFLNLLQEKRLKREKKEAEEKEERNKRQWIMASRIIDRLLMILYFVLYAGLTLTCLVILPNLSNSKNREGLPSITFEY